jgi:signal transduction histidine kinase
VSANRKVSARGSALFHSIQYVLGVVLVASAYVVTARLGRRVDQVSEELRVFFPQSGIGIAALMLCGLRFWPAVALGSGINLLLTRSPIQVDFLLDCLRSRNFPACLFTDDPVAFQLLPYIVLGNTLSAVFPVFALTRVVGFDHRFRKLADGYRFLLYAVLLAPVISAALATWGLVVLEPRARLLWPDVFFRRWFGQAVSNLLVTPPILAWSSKPRRRWPLARYAELASILALLFVLGVFAFTRSTAIGMLNYPVSYAPFPLVLWAALRFGVRGAVTSTLVISLIAVYGSSQGAGPFVREWSYPAMNVVLLQIYLVVLAMTGLLVGAATTERQATMEQLRESQEELRLLNERLESAREEERAHLARELHDELGQLLAGIRISAKRLIRLKSEPTELECRCEEIAAMSEEAVQVMRRLATSLRPGVLDDLGLVEAIRWQCEEFQRRYDIAVHYEPVELTAPLPKDLVTAFFRVLQESLTNVAKHAQAKSVVVRLWEQNGALHLEILDNGVGIEHTLKSSRAGCGIVGMRERLAMLEGQLDIGPNVALGHGTRVYARAPLYKRTTMQDTFGRNET